MMGRMSIWERALARSHHNKMKTVNKNTFMSFLYCFIEWLMEDSEDAELLVFAALLFVEVGERGQDPSISYCP